MYVEGGGHSAGSVGKSGDYAYSFTILKRKNFLSATPLMFALNSLILASRDLCKTVSTVC
jgi:hypothetical protein